MDLPSGQITVCAFDSRSWEEKVQMEELHDRTVSAHLNPVTRKTTITRMNRRRAITILGQLGLHCLHCFDS
jgi:hypothetical protein